jgi:hypothetical protein
MTEQYAQHGTATERMFWAKVVYKNKLCQTYRTSLFLQLATEIHNDHCLVYHYTTNICFSSHNLTNYNSQLLGDLALRQKIKLTLYKFY